ncbi:hypothetical protein F5Y18DRAFT_432893 [Xylariaceae sp. FL1019]|nr:hypothetical protein F5Y18DRAFT_432893 [Xylariaceae sp. FL1019]
MLEIYLKLGSVPNESENAEKEPQFLHANSDTSSPSSFQIIETSLFKDDEGLQDMINTRNIASPDDEVDISEENNVLRSHKVNSIAATDSILRSLNIVSDSSNSSFLAHLYDLVEAAHDGNDAHQAQRSSNRASSKSRGSKHSSKSPTKRPHHEDPESSNSDSEKQASKKQKSAPQDLSSHQPSLNFACPLFKMNPYVYSDCSRERLYHISKVGHHLKTKHTGDYHCRQCSKLFKNELGLIAHSHHDMCRPTRGPPVSEILPIPKTKGVDPIDRWRWIWSKLSPSMQPPDSPWFDENDQRKQIILSAFDALRKDEPCLQSLEQQMAFQADLVSRWAVKPPEHLPDLVRGYVEPNERRPQITNQPEGSASTIVASPESFPETQHTPIPSPPEESNWVNPEDGCLSSNTQTISNAEHSPDNPDFSQGPIPGETIDIDRNLHDRSDAGFQVSFEDNLRAMTFDDARWISVEEDSLLDAISPDNVNFLALLDGHEPTSNYRIENFEPGFDPYSGAVFSASEAEERVSTRQLGYDNFDFFDVEFLEQAERDNTQVP